MLRKMEIGIWAGTHLVYGEWWLVPYGPNTRWWACEKFKTVIVLPGLSRESKMNGNICKAAHNEFVVLFGLSCLSLTQAVFIRRKRTPSAKSCGPRMLGGIESNCWQGGNFPGSPYLSTTVIIIITTHICFSCSERRSILHIGPHY